jgi:putative membrane protein
LHLARCRRPGDEEDGREEGGGEERKPATSKAAESPPTNKNAHAKRIKERLHTTIRRPPQTVSESEFEEVTAAVLVMVAELAPEMARCSPRSSFASIESKLARAASLVRSSAGRPERLMPSYVDRNWYARGEVKVMSSQRVLSLAIRWLLLALAVWVAAQIVPGIHLEGWKSTFGVALILGLLNLYLRPILSGLVPLPLRLLTFGLFSVVINVALFWLTSWLAGHVEAIHFHVDSFVAALLGAVVISLVSLIVARFVDADHLARDLARRFKR